MTIVHIAAGHTDGEATDELFINRKFIVSYTVMDLTPQQEQRVKGMLRAAVEEGKRLRSQEIKALIG